MPARFELAVRYWPNDGHVLRYVIVAILSTRPEISGVGARKRKMRERERGRKRGRDDREMGRQRGGKGARATETSHLSLERVNAIPKRDENSVREKRGRLYIAKGKQHLKEDEGGERTIRGPRAKAREARRLTERERERPSEAGKEAASESLHPSIRTTPSRH